MKSNVINFFAGPCSGKSTFAAMLFSFLKKNNYNAELITEVAKDFVYENRLKTLQNDQLFVTASQNHKQLILQENNIEYIITDSPILLGCIYNKTINEELFNNFFLDIFNQYNNINFFIKNEYQKKFYENSGRRHNLEESKLAQEKIHKLLDTNKISYTEITQQTPLEKIYKTIISKSLRS